VQHAEFKGLNGQNALRTKLGKFAHLLQTTLAESVFRYAVDRKKAAGRALGTLVEIVTFYTLRAWNLRDHDIHTIRGGGRCAAPTRSEYRHG
jgi:hypothetical protein